MSLAQSIAAQAREAARRPVLAARAMEAAKCLPTLETLTPAQKLGARVRFLRLAHGMTQGRLSQRTGIARPNLARLEGGHTMPKLQTIVCVAAALGVQPSAILCVLDEVKT